MKKILALLLAICCVFAVASCGKEENKDETPKTDYGTMVSAIAEVINKSNPSIIQTSTSYAVDGTTYSGLFKTQVDKSKNKAVFDFTYTRPARVEEMNPTGATKTVSGAVYYSDGQVSANEGDTWVGAETYYLELDVKLDANKLKTCTVSEDGAMLTATVSPENAERIFGTKISSKGDISLVIETNKNNTYLYKISITYTASGTNAQVSVITDYDYGTPAHKFFKD